MYRQFIFENYQFDAESGIATFSYSLDHQLLFTETAQFEMAAEYDHQALNRALWLAFLLVGSSYYKCFPSLEVLFASHQLSSSDAELLNATYSDGLGQFMFENNLGLEDMVKFSADDKQDQPVDYSGDGILVLQSGGKDSLLLGKLLRDHGSEFATVYMSSSGGHPRVLDEVGTKPLRTIRRSIDLDALRLARIDGALDGHVPVTYITFSLALVDAILHGENEVLAAIGQEGNEAHEWIGDLAINHQWSKTWVAEQLLAKYVHDTVSPMIMIGSPLRSLTELRITELFVQEAWAKFGHRFSSCNLANYKQGEANSELTWCGECPKCANSFLLFAPFVEPNELAKLFNGENLFNKQSLVDTFKGLLGIEGVMKPFECVGEVGELRLAYHMARQKFTDDTYNLPFDVPESNFDYLVRAPSQDWTKKYAYQLE